MKKSLLIAIAGTDGSGKSTQVRLLKNKFQSLRKKVSVIKFPRYQCKSSLLIKQYLAGEFGKKADDVSAKTASSFYAYDRYMAAPVIRRKSKQGHNVILDRYVESNKGHQLGKIKIYKQRKSFLNWLNELEYKKNKIPKPDITFFLFLPIKYAKIIRTKIGTSGVANDIHEKDIKHLQAAQNAYLWTAKHDKVENWKIVNCLDKNKKRYTPKELHDVIWQIVKKKL